MQKVIPAIRQKVYHCSEQNKKAPYIEIDIFPFAESPNTKKSRKIKEYLTTPRRKALNDKNARRYFALLVKSNFDEGDYHITLTYAKQPKDIDEAEKKYVRNFLYRLRTIYKKKKIENLKYIYVTETGKNGRNIHHHILIKNSGISLREIKECWIKKGLGFANAREIQTDEKGIERLVSYLQKETAGKKRWKAAKNLVRPWVSISDTNFSRAKVEQLAKLPQDCQAVKKFWEKRFPHYILYEVKHYFNSVTARWSIYAKMKLCHSSITSGFSFS